MGSVFVGVGVGPGDPELVTGQARRVLREARRVFAPSTAPDAVGRAEAIVREAVPGVRVERVVFPMTGGAEARAAGHRHAAAAVVPHLDAGEVVAFATLGDPNVYSTFSSLATEVRRLRPGQEVATVPGIMAFQVLAAATGTVLLDDVEQLALVSAVDGTEPVAGALGDPTRAVVVYKGGRHLPEIARLLAEAGRLDDAVVGELLGLPGERVEPVAAVGGAPAAYLATVIVPPAGRGDGS